MGGRHEEDMLIFFEFFWNPELHFHFGNSKRDWSTVLMLERLPTATKMQSARDKDGARKLASLHASIASLMFSDLEWVMLTATTSASIHQDFEERGIFVPDFLFTCVSLCVV